MRVQTLINSEMSAGEKLPQLEEYWNPARSVVAEEITMWPAAVLNRGLLRSAWGHPGKCELDMDAYRFAGQLWGKTPLVSRIM